MILWPANIDSSKSHKHGRKLGKNASVQSPRLEEINDAAKRLSIEIEVVSGKSRPGSWWERTGYAILPKNDARSELLRSLAIEIRKARSAKTFQEKKG